MQNLNLNGKDLPLSGSNGYTTVDEHNVVHGCRTSGACQRNPCPRDRKCFETFDSYKCECLWGHSGADCKAFVTCDEKPCRNRGTCRPHPDGYSCACPAYYTGVQCHVQLDACASSPCKNGGICSPTSGGGFTCQCPERVSGHSCEFDTRPCASSPCFFNANCTNAGDDFVCHCQGDYSGKRCDEGFHCNREPCKNGGSCGENGACLCTEGFTGPDCSQDVDECTRRDMCNDGECMNTFGSFKCNCSSSSKGGERCDMVMPNISASEGGWPLGRNEIIGIAVVLTILLLIVLLVVILLRRRARRKRSSAPKVSPPVVGPDVASPADPPTPPPRQIHCYNVEELGMPPGYDSEDSWRRRERLPKDFGTMKTLHSSDANLPGYQWDYTDIPRDLIPLSKIQSSSAASEEGKPAPEVPRRPSSLRSSHSSLDIPEVPKRPRNYRLSESEDMPEVLHVPHVPKKPALYVNPRGRGGSRYSMDGSEYSEYTDIDHTDVFRGRFPGPPGEPYPESLDQYPVGSYAPTAMTGRDSEMDSVADFTEDDLKRVYLGNRLETCDDSPENSYLHSEACSEGENEDEDYGCGPRTEVEFHQTFQREIKEMMDELEDLKMESEI